MEARRPPGISSCAINSGMISAVGEGDIDTVRRLIDTYGLSYSSVWSNGYCLLVNALQSGHTNIARLLLWNGCKVDRNDRSKRRRGFTPLHLAVSNSNEEVVKMLLDRFARLESVDYTGKTPLFRAVESGNLKITELLLKQHCCVNSRCTSKWGGNTTPLQYACAAGDEGLVNLLLSNGAVMYRNTGGFKRMTLHKAVEKNSVLIVKLILDQEPDIDARDRIGRSALLIAAQNGREEIVKLLLDSGAQLGVKESDRCELLRAVIEKCDTTIIEHILKTHAELVDERYGMCLDAARRISHDDVKIREIWKLFRQYGFSVDILLHTAVGNEFEEIVEDLLKTGVDVNMPVGVKKITPLRHAIDRDSEKMARLLISRGADVDAVNEGGEPLVLYAIRKKDQVFTELLLASGASTKKCPNILHIAVAENSVEVVTSLLQYISDSDIDARDDCGKTALHYTCLGSSEDNCTAWHRPCSCGDDARKGRIAELLLQRGADVDATSDDGMTTLCRAIKNITVVEALLKHDADVNYATDDGTTPLHCCVKNGTPQVCELLLKKGARVDSKTIDGATALYVKCARKHHSYGDNSLEIVEILLKHKAEVNYAVNDDKTPLHVAVESNDAGIVKALIRSGADVDARDKLGRTALHIASKSASSRVVSDLLDYGADVTVKCGESRTAFDYAIVRSSERNETFTCFEKQEVKMSLLNPGSCDKQSSLRTEYQQFYDECRDQVERMRKRKIGGTNVTFYDIATESVEKIPVYANNGSIREALASHDHESTYPNYCGVIDGNFQRGKKRLELLDLGADSFNSLLGYVLPDIATMAIFRYLSVKDLKNLAKSCED